MLGGHISYMLNSSLTLGAFYTHEDWDGVVFYEFGVEAWLGKLSYPGCSGTLASLDFVYSFGAAGPVWAQRNFSTI